MKVYVVVGRAHSRSWVAAVCSSPGVAAGRASVELREDKLNLEALRDVNVRAVERGTLRELDRLRRARPCGGEHPTSYEVVCKEVDA